MRAVHVECARNTHVLHFRSQHEPDYTMCAFEDHEWSNHDGVLSTVDRYGQLVVKTRSLL
jgi:hypothetical protein